MPWPLPRPDDRSDARRGSRAVAAALLVAAAGLVALVLFRIYPHRVPQDGKPGFVDTIFASAVVVFGARVVLLALVVVLGAGMAFLVVSIWKRAQAGHWVMTFGPFETRAIEVAGGAAERWRDAWEGSQAQVASLRADLEVATAEVALLAARLQAAEAERP